jgi:hypothetical protein
MVIYQEYKSAFLPILSDVVRSFVDSYDKKFKELMVGTETGLLVEYEFGSRTHFAHV